MDGQNRRGLKWIAFGCMKNVGLPVKCTVFQFMLLSKLYLQAQLENQSQLLCGHNFTNERLLVCQFDVSSS